MICQKCKQQQATTHVKQTVNGKTTEMMLCSSCASALGMNVLSTSSFDVGNLFGSLFAEPFLRESSQQSCCPGCGKTLKEIVQSGLVGCPNCYTTFYERLLPSIQRIHGKTTHVGKVAAAGSVACRKDHELETLRTALEEAVAKQEFERCAQIRDQIKELEGDGHE